MQILKIEANHQLNKQKQDSLASCVSLKVIGKWSDDTHDK